MAQNVVVLKTSDDKSFEIEEIVAKQSDKINSMIANGYVNFSVPLPNITGEICAKIIEYCKRHAATTPNMEEEKKEELINFDAEFINVDQKILLDLLMAANYLDIQSLLDLACKKVADMIKGKTPEEIRETFNIENDLSPEEEEEIRKKNAWAFE